MKLNAGLLDSFHALQRVAWQTAVLGLFILSIADVESRHACAADANKAGERLHALFDAEWEWALREEPTFASYLGDRRYNDRWPDRSLTANERRQQHRVDVLKQLDEMDASQLSPADRINLQLFRLEYANSVEAHPFGWHLVPLNQREGIQDENSVADAMRFDREKDFEDWIARLKGFPTYMDQTLDLMREGVRTGRVHSRVVMQRLPNQIRRQVVEDCRKSLFFKPFLSMPDSIPAAIRERRQQEAEAAIREHVVPSFQRMLEFFEQTYLPACTEKVGVWQWPHGRELYAMRARHFTTTNLTPKQIHEIGLSEVKRIRAEMEKVVQEVKFTGSFESFLKQLRSQESFYFKSADELLLAYRDVCKRVDPQLVKLFKKLPRIPYGIEPIPAHIAPDTTTAYYREPSVDGRRAGTYFVNLYRPETRPKYEIEVLSLHEAVPGHHLQIALAMELENLPSFRRYSGYTAFVEGWALYTENLGKDLGLYSDPYSKFGQLTYEMWRAVRLVVDTGMHDMEWTRDQSISFFESNTAKARLDIENEVDRYIAWPGQALAYKIGELKIKELRAKAERTLGEKFDIRDFHEVVLGSGAVTLDVLEANVNDWIERLQKT